MKCPPIGESDGIARSHRRRMADALVVADLKGDVIMNLGDVTTLGLGFAFLVALVLGLYFLSINSQHHLRAEDKKEAAEQRAAVERENDKLREEARRIRVGEKKEAADERAAVKKENDKLREEARRIRGEEKKEAENVRLEAKEEAEKRRAADERQNEKIVAALQKTNDALIAANKTANDALVTAIRQAGVATQAAVEKAGVETQAAVEKQVGALKDELKAINAKITSPLASRSTSSANVFSPAHENRITPVPVIGDLN